MEEGALPVYYTLYPYPEYCRSILGPAYTQGIHRQLTQQHLNNPGGLPPKIQYWHPGMEKALWLCTQQEEQRFHSLFPDAIAIHPLELKFRLRGTEVSG